MVEIENATFISRVYLSEADRKIIELEDRVKELELVVDILLRRVGSCELRQGYW